MLKRQVFLPLRSSLVYSPFRKARLTGAVYLGGNIIISFVFLPSLKRISSTYDRVGAWSKQYDIASKIMASLGGVACLSFGTAAYYAPTNYVRNSMIASAVLSISVIPFTILFIRPTVVALKAIEKERDTVNATAEGDKLIEKWGKLSLIRWSFMAIASLNGLKELSG